MILWGRWIYIFKWKAHLHVSWFVMNISSKIFLVIAMHCPKPLIIYNLQYCAARRFLAGWNLIEGPYLAVQKHLCRQLMGTIVSIISSIFQCVVSTFFSQSEPTCANGPKISWSMLSTIICFVFQTLGWIKPPCQTGPAIQCLHKTSWRELGADLPTVPPFL